MNTDTYLKLLLIVPAVALLGITGGSTANQAGQPNYPSGYVQIAPRAYNSESGSFDRPWPFGPESSQQ